jgi:hypothetical protein
MKFTRVSPQSAHGLHGFDKGASVERSLGVTLAKPFLGCSMLDEGAEGLLPLGEYLHSTLER